MSQSRTIEYTCPYCGRKYETTIYETITADEDEDLREKCVSGDIFHVECPHCHKDYMIQFPLLYIDRAHKFVLWVSDQEPIGEMMEVGKALSRQGYTLRRTPTISEFTEKISVLEDGVDDRMVELAKYDSFIEVINNGKAKPEEVTSVEYQNTNDEVMKINVRMGDRGMGFLIPTNGMVEEMDQERELYQIVNEAYPIINTEWVIDLFDDPDGKA